MILISFLLSPGRVHARGRDAARGPGRDARAPGTAASDRARVPAIVRGAPGHATGIARGACLHPPSS